MLKTEIEKGKSGRMIIMDSISKVTPEDKGAIVVCASRGGASSGEFALEMPLKAVIFNDAGVGKDDAGILALEMLQSRGVAAAEAKGASIHNLVVFPVQALLHEPGAREVRYSMDLGEAVVNEIKVEILCPDEAVAPVVELIKRIGHTGDHEEGWVVVTDVLSAQSIGAGGGGKP